LNNPQRNYSFAENYSPSWIDRLGVWLSAKQIQKWIPEFENKSIGDFGCGFHASLSRALLSRAHSVTLVDVSLSQELKSNPKIRAIEGSLPQSLTQIPHESLDIILCISVLEHLWEPQKTLEEFHRILNPGGICLINVPSWRGKKFLEYSAFVLGLSPKQEMEDHKMYYDVKDLWPLLVRVGFKPSHIQCFIHKFGLNCFAVIRKEKKEKNDSIEFKLSHHQR